MRPYRRRGPAGAEGIAGLFINTLPMRVWVAPERKLLPWLQELRKEWLELREFEHTPLPRIQGWVAPAGSPLFQSILNVQDPSWDAELRAQGGSWARRQLRIVNQPSSPLAMDVYASEELVVKLVYNRQRFDEGSIARMACHFRTLLEGMAAHPEQELGKFRLLTEAESRLFVEWNRTEADFPDVCMHQLFEAQAERTPAAIALSDGERQLSYQELDERANQLAHQIQELGVKPDVLVGIWAERSLEMVVGQLAILKAGGAYVPIDPAYPEERVRFILQDAGIRVLLTQGRTCFSGPVEGGTTKSIISLEEVLWARIVRAHASRPKNQATPRNLAYVIYTSGSTGQPKGVEIEHGGL